jgi:hypothetical protein
LRRRKNGYFDSSFLERPSMVKLIKKSNYFHQKIKKCINEGDDYEKERPSTPTRIIKCSFVKEFIIWY